MRQIVLVGGLLISVFLIAFVIYPWGGWLPSILLFLVMLVTLVRAYSAGHRYRCANCGHVFRVPVAVDFLTGGGIGKNADGTYHNWKSLTCPSCGQRSRAVVVKVDPDVAARELEEQSRLAGSDEKAAAGQREPATRRSPHAKRARKRR